MNQETQSPKSKIQNAPVFAFVPSYNHAPFIERCLRSIFKQTYAPAKLLVIDDGSKDDSPRLITRILSDCPFPSEFIARENRGLCATLNEGFDRSEGEFFAYLGSDDVWLQQFIENRVELLGQNPNAVLAYGNAFLIDENDAVIENSARWNLYKADNEREMLLRGIAPISSSVLYRRASLEKVRWNDDSRLEDYELYLKMLNVGAFAFDENVAAAWRQHDHNTSGDTDLMLTEVLAALNRNAESLGISDEAQKRKYMALTELAYSENFARNYNKSAALRILRKNFYESPSVKFVLRSALRLLIPNAILRWRKSVNRRNTAREYQNFNF
ncbi:MAG: glycosyltransferase [Pyrinomonadaceae bacterium]|nr:glycosyltransferase [Pyrinomonadaceae bacterium]